MTTIQPRHLFLVVSAFILLVLSLSHAAPPETGTKVDTVDSAGIRMLIKAKGGPMVIVAMAAWCLPCREELPALVKLYDKYKSQGLKMVGISLDQDGPSAIQPLLDKANVNFPVYWAGEKAVYDFKIYAIPMLLLIKDGAIVERVVGRKPGAFLDKKISDLLSED